MNKTAELLNTYDKKLLMLCGIVQDMQKVGIHWKKGSKQMEELLKVCKQNFSLCKKQFQAIR
jgi:hypothetical protein